MRSIHAILKGLIVLILIVLAVWFRSGIIQGLRAVRLTITALTVQGDRYKTLQSLERENKALKTQLAAIEEEIAAPEKSRLMPVHSEYPFNDKRELVVGAGTLAGLKPGLVVLSGDGVLVGKIVAATKYQSRAQTMFDPKWLTSVSIGAKNIRAVLKGGSPPHLELVPADAPLETGDIVKSISPDLPIHTPIGTIAELKDKSGTIWGNVSVAPFFAAEDITAVRVLTDFP